ncbi:MAG: ATP-grasp domain-containing protein [Actinomycetota bacterium]
MPRIALIVPTTTYRAADFLDAARRAGVEVVIASDDEPHPLAIDQVSLDLADVGEAARALAEAARGVDAVVGVDDHGVEIAARAAARLGLDQSPPEAVARTRDKAAMRRALDGVAGVRQPPFAVAGPHDDVAALAAEVGPPVVVKPTSLSASRGVIRADDPAAAAAAAARCRRILAAAGEDPDGPLLVEGYLPGVEVAVEGLLTDGRLEVLAVFDKPDPLEGPYFEETLYVTPSRLPEETLTAIAAATAAATAGLGLRQGPVHAELRVDDGEPALLEVAARTIGGHCGRSLRFGLDMPLEEVVLRNAAGLPTHALAPAGGASGALMLPIPRSGVLRAVAGLEAARAVDGVDGVELSVPLGGTVEALPEGGRYLGFAFASAARPEEVEAALRAAWAALEITIDPEGAPDAPQEVSAGCASP